MVMISKETAMDIALAYREVETAEKLLTEVIAAKQSGGAPDVRDAFGRQQGGLQLGIPNGHSGRQLFEVPWSLAIPIMEAHVAHHKAKIAALTEKARAELS